MSETGVLFISRCLGLRRVAVAVAVAVAAVAVAVVVAAVRAG